MSNVPESDLAGSTGQLEAVTPRNHLPDDWSGKGACPVCRRPGQLQVRHHDDAPDAMVCSACGTVFQVETGGARIRLVAAPPTVAHSASFLNIWLMPGELRTRLETALPGQPILPAEPPAPSIPAALVNGAEAAPPESKVANAARPGAEMPANGAAEPAPGTDDWFASLAAAIGGLALVPPPPDDVLADELERLLTTRAAAVADSAGGTAPDAAASPAGGADSPVVTLVGKDAALPALGGTLEQATRATTAPPRVAKPELVAPEAAGLAGPDKSPGNGAVPRQPEPAAAVIVPPVESAVASGELAAEPTLALTAAAAVDSDTQAVAVAATLPSAPSPMGPSPSRHELAERAWKLHELGNSLASIQSALEASRGAPEDVAAIMSKLTALEQARRARFRRNLQISVGGGLAVLLVLLVVALLISLNPPLASTPAPGATGVPETPASAPTAVLSYNPLIALLNQVLPGDVKIANGPSPTPAATSGLLGGLFPATPTLSEADLATEDAKKSSLPSWVSTLVPNGITVLNVPTPSVDKNGPAGSPCPTTADQASALFGGPAASWSFNRQEGGWIFILANNPTTIRVPANMSAGYLALGASLEMRSVLGPATIHNVNFAALSCAQ